MQTIIQLADNCGNGVKRSINLSSYIKNDGASEGFL
jgi:hypothetical protein